MLWNTYPPVCEPRADSQTEMVVGVTISHSPELDPTPRTQALISESWKAVVCVSASYKQLPHPPCPVGPGCTTADAASQVPGRL